MDFHRTWTWAPDHCLRLFILSGKKNCIGEILYLQENYWNPHIILTGMHFYVYRALLMHQFKMLFPHHLEHVFNITWNTPELWDIWIKTYLRPYAKTVLRAANSKWRVHGCKEMSQVRWEQESYKTLTAYAIISGEWAETFLAMDILKLLLKPVTSNQFALVMMDHHLNWIRAVPTFNWIALAIACLPMDYGTTL